MDKIIKIIIIAVLSMILTGLIVFAVQLGKNTLNEEDNKQRPKNNQTESIQSKTNQEDNTQEETTQQLETNQEDNTQQLETAKEENSSNQEDPSYDPNNIKRFDKDNNGFITRSEADSDPEALEAEEKGLFQAEPDGLAEDPYYFFTDEEKEKMGVE